MTTSQLHGIKTRQALLAACILACIANALAYTWLHSNPLLASDTWHYLDVFVRKALTGDLTLTDFFAKRSGLDHAQPINKLILYLDTITSGLDFTYEALVGILFGILAIFLIWGFAHQEVLRGRYDAGTCICLVAVAAVFFSLNSSSLFTWYLVTLGYSLHALAILLVWLSWRSLVSGRSLGLISGAALIALCADDSAYIFTLAIICGVLFTGYRLGRARDAWRVTMLLLAGLIIARLIYSMPALQADGGSGGLSMADRIGVLRQHISDIYLWLVVPSACSLMCAEQLSHYFGEGWKQWELILGSIMIAVQVWFWVVIWKTRPSRMVFAAITLMLLGYGDWAGILYGRIPEFGAEYFYQPRYVLVYMLVPVALLLMGMVRLSTSQAGRVESSIIVTVAAGIIAMQLPLSTLTWRNAIYVDNYYQNMADQMFAIARHPGVDPANCVPLLTVCDQPQSKREDLFALLRTYRLNLFSREFSNRHSMYEGDAPR